MDEYEKLLMGSKGQEFTTEHEQKLHKKMKRSISSSKIKMILLTLTIALLLVPTSFIVTLAYYTFGTKSTTIMDVTSQTLYITEPNTSLEEIEFDMDFTPFSMQLQFDQYKRIGSEDYKANTYKLSYMFNNLTEKSVNTSLERVSPKNPTETNVWLTHPYNSNEIYTSREWEVLEGLPDQTVVEAYISLNDLMSVQDLRKQFSSVELAWAAVYTGVEETNLSADGDVVSPIGYPLLEDRTTWSPFNTDEQTKEEIFLEMLNFLTEHEELATAVSSAKNLALQERTNYIKKNGIQVYGVVITGPKNEILAFKKWNMIRSMKVGEVKLWNWAK